VKAAKRKARAAARAKDHSPRRHPMISERQSIPERQSFSERQLSGVNATPSMGRGSPETRRLDSRHPAVLGPVALATDPIRHPNVADAGRSDAANGNGPVGAAYASGEARTLGAVAVAATTLDHHARSRNRDWLAECLRVGIGGALLWAGLSKAANGVAFLAALNAYELPLPRVALAAVAIALPWIEILCGLSLVTRTRVAPALLLSLLLTFGFCVATGQAVLRGLDISCGCFDLDFLSATPWPQAQKVLESVAAALIRNLAMLAGIVFLLGRFEPATQVSGPQTGPRE
jgi:uncharacterized membrane protein YphA (DoxX/SURF4 family)